MAQGTETIEHEADGVTLVAEIRPIEPGHHVWTGEYSIDTDAGIDGPYDLGQGTEDELRQRFATVADGRS